MGTDLDYAATLRHRLVVELKRDYQWLADESGRPYKRVLREVKHGQGEMSLSDSIAYAKALGWTLPQFVKAARELPMVEAA